MLHLNDPTLLMSKAFIDGEWVENGKTFAVSNPSTGSTLAQVADLGVEDLARAIDAAHRAQPGWAGLSGKERSTFLKHWHRLLVANADDLARILTAEMGKPLAEAKNEVLYGASFIEWFAEEAKRIYGDVIPGHGRDKRILVLKQPVGVVGAITPWNFPNAMLARKVAPALAVGCTMVARPSELTPLSALAMAVLAERAGIPAGVFNVTPGLDAAAMGSEFCSNRKVAKVTFTGSTRVGKILMQQSAGTVKKLSLELGGNAPFIIFGDADVDKAVEGVMAAKFRNGGQTCVCANRIYVHASVHDAFLDKLTSATAALKVGDGFDESVAIGPLINLLAVEKVEAHISDAVSKGARIAVGGKRHPLGATFFQPTVLTKVNSDMRVSREETFGPVAPIFQFEDERNVLAAANEGESGLAGYLYTNDINRIWRMSEGMEVGMVGINTGLISTEVAPFGGIKESGLGREGSKYGADDYLQIKTLCFGDVS